MVSGVNAEILNATASLSSGQAGTGEAIQLTVQIATDEQAAKLPWPQIEGLGNFTVTKNSGSSANSQTTIINGKISQSSVYVTNFIYTLVSNKPGTYSIGPISYSYKNFTKTLGSASITISKQESGLQLVPSLSKRQAYVGEQLTYMLRIIPNANVQKVTPPDFQKVIGEKFWFQHLDKDVQAKNVVINGQNARVFDVRIVLFPLLSGTTELPGVSVDYQQISRSTRRHRTGSIFDMLDDDAFFGGGSIANLTAQSSPMSLEIKPLPGGAPSDFSGAVGQYTLSANIDKNTLASGEALTLTITIKGNGEPKTITKPLLPDLSSFEIFDPEINSSTNVIGNTLWTTKTFKYVLVPHRVGNTEIGPIGFSFFNSEKGIYTSAKSQPYSITIKQGKEMEQPRSLVSNQKEITELGSDIRHIKGNTTVLIRENNYLYKHFGFWFLFSLAPLTYAGLMIFRRRQILLASDASLKRKSLASSALKKRMKEAREAMQQSKGSAFYKALDQAIIGFISDKLNVEFRGLTLQDAKQLLIQKGASTQIAEEYEGLIQQCDFGQFSGQDKNEEHWKMALQKAEDILSRLEKEI